RAHEREPARRAESPRRDDGAHQAHGLARAERPGRLQAYRGQPFPSGRRPDRPRLDRHDRRRHGDAHDPDGRADVDSGRDARRRYGVRDRKPDRSPDRSRAAQHAARSLHVVCGADEMSRKNAAPKGKIMSDLRHEKGAEPVLALFAAVFALVAAPSHAQAPGQPSAVIRVDCDRDCLIGYAERYLDALVHRDTTRAPFARHARFTENNVEMPLGEGLWGTINAVWEDSM